MSESSPIFQDLLEIVNQVRFLALVLHLSITFDRLRLTLHSFHEKCELVKSRLLELPSMTGQNRSHLFECCRYATLTFLEFALRGTDSHVPSVDIFAGN
jgi:hypothetical protein